MIILAVGHGLTAGAVPDLDFARPARRFPGKAGIWYAAPMPDLVSEPITPMPGTLDASRMARGEPGLPGGFTCRGQSYHVVEVLETWKLSSREGGGAGDLYLRRHYYKLRMSDRSIWIIYFVRQTPKSGSPKNRWFLYTVEPPDSDNLPDSKPAL